MSNIIIQGAREHNLQNVSVAIPRNQLTVITGLSGSGKSSLAFDTLFAEGQRRYIESLSAYARQFLDQLGKPDVDFVGGLSPAISIEQHSAASNPRSIVATTTEIMDYARLLYANAGQPHCPKCGRAIKSQSAEQIVEELLKLPEGTRVNVLAPIARDRRGDLSEELAAVRAGGFARVRIDGEMYDLDSLPKLAKTQRHTLEIGVDRLVVKPGVTSRLTDSMEIALKQGNGVITAMWMLPSDEPDAAREWHEHLYSEKNACPDCRIAFDELKASYFSFNSPNGACPVCSGLGQEMYFDESLVVPHPEKHLTRGAIAPWSRGPRRLVGLYNKMLNGLCAHYGCDPLSRWEDLPRSLQQLVLYGSGEEIVPYSFRMRGSMHTVEKPFEGVIPNLQRRMSDSPSDYVRYVLREYMSMRKCTACHGRRLKPEVLACEIGGRGIMDFLALSVRDALDAVKKWKFTDTQMKIVGQSLDEIRKRLQFLDNVGLSYLTLDRESSTLSGGEMQRIRLATQIGSALVGVLYVLDEPTIGLHPCNTVKLIKTLRDLQARGNTVVVVEHDEEMIREADYLIDMGPGAGRNGGHVVFQGPLSQLPGAKDSLTSRFIFGGERMPVPGERHAAGKEFITVKGARANNLKNITVKFPLGCFTAVTGVSGSGKSTLVNDVLLNAIRTNAADKFRQSVAEDADDGEVSSGSEKNYDSITGLQKIDKVIVIDQSPIGRTPRSNPATYAGAFNTIRDLYAALPASKARGYKPGRFSFNVKGGRCETCKGDGVRRLEMNFLPDVYVPCEQCGGKRYNRETLEVKYGGRSISDTLELTIDEALAAFAPITRLKRIFQTLSDVGLGYMQVGQAATTLSGGEAQRVKLATELSRPPRGHTLYILDEPTTGLHFADVRKLISILWRLRDMGHTVLVIEHNPDIMRAADYLIDLGPEGGDGGGRVIAAGTPEEVAQVEGSRTGEFLRGTLMTQKTANAPKSDNAQKAADAPKKERKASSGKRK